MLNVTKVEVLDNEQVTANKKCHNKCGYEELNNFNKSQTLK